MPEAQIPPWMVSNPLAGIPFFLSGYGQGSQAGESRRRGEQYAYELELQQAAQQERNEILREAKQIQAQEFAESLKLKQDEAARAARTAAIRLEGQQGMEKDIQSGMGFEEAITRHASKLFHEEPQALSNLLRQLQPAKNIMPVDVTVGGRRLLVNPAQGSFQINEPSETTRVDEGLAPGTYARGKQLFKVAEPKPAKPHQLQKELDKQRAALAAARVGLAPEIAVPPLEAAVASLEQSIAASEGIKAKESSKQLTVEQAKEFLKQASGDKAKARQLAKDAGYTF